MGLKHLLTGGAAGTVAAASLLTCSLFAHPAEIMAWENGTQPIAADTAVVSLGKRPASTPRMGKASLAKRLREFLVSMPTLIKALVLLPLWCVGKAGITLISLLFTALSPVLQTALSFLLNAAVLLGICMLAYHFLFPNKPLRTLFRNKTLVPLILGSLLLAVTDGMLRLCWPEYGPIAIGIRVLLGFGTLGLLCRQIFEKKRPIQNPQSEVSL